MCVEFKYKKLNTYYTSFDNSLKVGELLVTASHVILKRHFETHTER